MRQNKVTGSNLKVSGTESLPTLDITYNKSNIIVNKVSGTGFEPVTSGFLRVLGSSRDSPKGPYESGAPPS